MALSCRCQWPHDDHVDLEAVLLEVFADREGEEEAVIVEGDEFDDAAVLIRVHLNMSPSRLVKALSATLKA